MNINLDSALAAHAAWKVKLRSAMASHEKLDAALVGADNCCELGRWLHGEGQRGFGGKPDFVALVEHHATFHRAAGAVAVAINQGKFDEAEKMLGAGTPYAKSSNEVGAAVIRVKRMLTPA